MPAFRAELGRRAYLMAAARAGAGQFRSALLAELGRRRARRATSLATHDPAFLRSSGGGLAGPILDPACWPIKADMPQANGYRAVARCLTRTVTDVGRRHDAGQRARVRGGGAGAVPGSEQTREGAAAGRVLPDDRLPSEGGGAAAAPAPASADARAAAGRAVACGDVDRPLRAVHI